MNGYPKTLDNLEELERQCGACTAVINLDGDETVLGARLIERGKTSYRTDDTPEAIQRRFRTFQEQASSMIDALKKRDIVHDVNASPSREEVFDAARQVYERVMGY